MGVGGPRKIRVQPGHTIAKFNENTKKSPGDPRGISVTQSSIKKNTSWKTGNNNNNIRVLPHS